MRVLFINSTNFLEAALPEGIAILSAILKGKGHEVRLFDTAFLKPKGYHKKKKGNEKSPHGPAFYKATPYDLNDLVMSDPEVDIDGKLSEAIADFNPSLIAFSAMTTNYTRALALADNIGTKAKVIFGGVHPTLMPDDVIIQKRINYVCIGDRKSVV